MGIIVLGGTGVGKSTVGRVLSQKTGYPLYEVGYVVKNLYVEKIIEAQNTLLSDKKLVVEELNGLVLKHGKQVLTQKRLDFTKKIVKKEGPDYFVRVLMERYPGDRKIIVGVRSFSEIDAINKEMKHPFYVGLMCEEDMLLSRFTNREKAFMNEKDAKSIFIRRYDIEHDWGVDEVMNRCNIVLTTDYCTPEELARDIIAHYELFLESRENV